MITDEQYVTDIARMSDSYAKLQDRYFERVRRIKELDEENRLLRIFIAAKMVMFQSEINDALVELKANIPEMNRVLNE